MASASFTGGGASLLPASGVRRRRHHIVVLPPLPLGHDSPEGSEQEGEYDGRGVRRVGGPGPGRAVAQLEGAETHLLDIVAVGMSLALAIEHFVLGGAASANHSSFWNKERKRARNELSI